MPDFILSILKRCSQGDEYFTWIDRLACINQNELAHYTCSLYDDLGILDCLSQSGILGCSHTLDEMKKKKINDMPQRRTLQYDLGIRWYIPHLPKRNRHRDENDMEHNQYEQENHQ